MSRRKRAVTNRNRSTPQKALDGFSSAVLLAGGVVFFFGGFKGIVAGALLVLLGAGIALLGNSQKQQGP